MMTKKINSRAKGAAGEREFRDELRKRGYGGARRGQQYEGSSESPDVICAELSEFHFEVKRVEAGNLYKWLEQAKTDAPARAIPVVVHRRNHKEWVAILPLSDFLNLAELS